MEQVFIGIGSNLGNAYQNCIQGITLVHKSPNCSVQSIAPFYYTEPQGVSDQPWFVNSVIEVKTSLHPISLLKLCLQIEEKLNRTRSVRWGPRTLDLDILLWNQRIVISSALIIPHPRMHTRRFVLEPLHDLAPEYIHPILGKTIKTILLELNDCLSTTRINKEFVL